MTTQRYEPYQSYPVYERRPLDPETEGRLRRVTTSTLAAVLAKQGYPNLFLPGVARVAGAHRPGTTGKVRSAGSS